MKMQRRHFEFIARVIREDIPFEDSRIFTARVFAEALAGTNPGFDRDKFMDACRPGTRYRDKS